MIIKTKIKKIGNSLRIIFPKDIIKQENLKVGERLFLVGIEKIEK